MKLTDAYSIYENTGKTITLKNYDLITGNDFTTREEYLNSLSKESLIELVKAQDDLISKFK